MTRKTTAISEYRIPSRFPSQFHKPRLGAGKAEHHDSGEPRNRQVHLNEPHAHQSDECGGEDDHQVRHLSFLVNTSISGSGYGGGEGPADDVAGFARAPVIRRASTRTHGRESISRWCAPGSSTRPAMTRYSGTAR